MNELSVWNETGDEFPKDFYVKSLKKVFIFKAETAKLRKEWVESIKGAQDAAGMSGARKSSFF